MHVLFRPILSQPFYECDGCSQQSLEGFGDWGVWFVVVMAQMKNNLKRSEKQ